MSILAIIGTVFRVIVIIVVLIGILKIKKTRLRHVPARRTRISRHHGVPTLWLERLVNAVLDMMHASAASANNNNSCGTPKSRTSIDSSDIFSNAQQPGMALPFIQQQRSGEHSHRSTPRAGQSGRLAAEAINTSKIPREQQQPPPASPSSNIRFPTSEKARGEPAASHGCDGDGKRSEMLLQLEERVNAILEDSGIAVWSDFRIHSLGDKPPRVKAVHVTNTTTPIGGAPPSSSGGGAGGGSVSGGVGNNASAVSNGSFTQHHGQKPSASPDVVSRASLPDAESTNSPSSNMHHTPPASASGGGGGQGLNSSMTGGGVAQQQLLQHSSTALEVELEVEYSGGLDVSLQADLSVARGRQLPVYVRLCNVKYVRAHVHAVVALHVEEATLETPRKPYLQATICLESDPAFDMTMRTSLTRFTIQNFFLVPMLAKFFFLRFVRNKLRRRGAGEGIQVKIPLPEDVVDGGESMWCGLGSADVRDTMSEASVGAASSWFREAHRT